MHAVAAMKDPPLRRLSIHPRLPSISTPVNIVEVAAAPGASRGRVPLAPTSAGRQETNRQRGMHGDPGRTRLAARRAPLHHRGPTCAPCAVSNSVPRCAGSPRPRRRRRRTRPPATKALAPVHGGGETFRTFGLIGLDPARSFSRPCSRPPRSTGGWEPRGPSADAEQVPRAALRRKRTTARSPRSARARPCPCCQHHRQGSMDRYGHLTRDGRERRPSGHRDGHGTPRAHSRPSDRSARRWAGAGRTGQKTQQTPPVPLLTSPFAS